MNTTSTLENDKVRQSVRDAYGAIARTSGSCCGPSSNCGAGAPTDALTLGYSPGDLAQAPKGSEMGLGCGNPLAIASIKPGEVVVDLGSGGGFDCFLAAKKTGPAGRVIGVDMTPDMISKARLNASKGGHDNVEFRLGEIEHLPVADNSADLIISNCVINLSPDKAQVFRDAFRVLKPGGRLAISDIVATQEIPAPLQQDHAAHAGCIAGAAQKSEVESLLAAAGFRNVRVSIREESRAFINDWLPGRNAADYVVSATIEATK
jgi:SAM-dependent methyltransferase